MIRLATATVFERLLWSRVFRRTLEYAIAVATALACSYWIVQGR